MRSLKEIARRVKVQLSTTLRMWMFLIVGVGACTPLSQHDSQFGVTNASTNKIQLMVQDAAAGPVVPGPGAARFGVGVLMASSGGPTGNRPQVSVKITAYNLDTHTMSRSTQCTAGPDFFTSVTYDKQSNLSCTSSRATR